MAEPTLQTIQDRALALYTENCKEYPYRVAFEFATEQVFNQLNIGKYARTVLRAAISKSFGPYYFQEEKTTEDNLARCVRVLYNHGVDIDSGITEALRQYRVEHFPNRLAFRHQVGAILEHRGGKRTQKLIRERKNSTQTFPQPSPMSLFSGNRLQ